MAPRLWGPARPPKVVEDLPPSHGCSHAEVWLWLEVRILVDLEGFINREMVGLKSIVLAATKIGRYINGTNRELESFLPHWALGAGRSCDVKARPQHHHLIRLVLSNSHLKTPFLGDLVIVRGAESGFRGE